jgi:hypothetical protein
LPSWPWLAALWPPSAALLLSVAPQMQITYVKLERLPSRVSHIISF